MKKIYIFGASKGGENYLRHIENDASLQILGFLDNDSRKHGQSLCGQPIFGPSVLSGGDFDEVHVASMWTRKIHLQLVESLAVPAAKIIDLPKHLIKRRLRPFETAEGQAAGKRLISEMSEYFAAHDTCLVLDGGCLLGIMRDQMLIPWDDDIDFLVHIADAGKVVALLRRFAEESQFRHTHHITVDDGAALTGMQFVAVNLTPSGPHREEDEIDVSFSMMTRIGDSMTARSGMSTWPAYLHDGGLRWIDLHPGRATCVEAVEDFLTFIYGDWRVVNRDVSFYDYQNWS